MRLMGIIPAAALAFVVHAQGQYEGLTEDQINESAHESALRGMAADVSTERAVYLSNLLSSPEVQEALERDGEFILDAAGVSLSGIANSIDDADVPVYSGASSTNAFAKSTVVAIIVCPRFQAFDPHKGSGRGTADVPVVKGQKQSRMQPDPYRAGIPAA